VPWAWDWLCRPFVNWAEPWLRAGRRRGRRRALLAAALRKLRGRWAVFFTVQSPADERRLRAGGAPWPSGAFRAHLGPGVYAWERLSEARVYRRMLLRRTPDLRILRFAVSRSRLRSLHTINVDELEDPEAWMRRHSSLWTDAPVRHGAQYVRRHTTVRRGDETAVEHYFAASAFRFLCFCRGPARAD
jgi:hypothetical protein